MTKSLYDRHPVLEILSYAIRALPSSVHIEQEDGATLTGNLCGRNYKLKIGCPNEVPVIGYIGSDGVDDASRDAAAILGVVYSNRTGKTVDLVDLTDHSQTQIIAKS